MTVKEIAKKEPQGLIGRAYRFAEQAHKGQKRKSGEPFFNHCIATAETLNSWRLDDATIAAGLLHDVVEDTLHTREELIRLFGEEIEFLVDGVTKLGKVLERSAEAKAENLRKMILALSKDLRVVFIKLADRLHNMRTLSALPPVKQKRIALETDEIYAPLSYRLGMQNLSGELQDLAFPYLYPKEDKWLRQTIKDRYTERLEYLTRIKPSLEEGFSKEGIAPLTIDFRAKRYSSLYKKLMHHDMDIEKIYDLVAMRIIVESVADCYAVLGTVHQLWPPMPGRIKDYIAMPKPNSYRSLHTTVIGPEGKFIEIQIRTKQMHDQNENGIAAHWLYEQYRSDKESKRRSAQEIAEEVRWVQQLRNWQEKYNETTDANEFLQSMKVDFFKDRIFTITPKGDVVDLPVGSTPIDFAYHIHSDVGNMCVAAKVNNRFMPLDHPLRSGDMVEILLQKNKRPSDDWLTFVKTSVAKDHIKAALRDKKSRMGTIRPSTKAEVRVTAKNRIGLIKDISGIFSRSHFPIVSVNTAPQTGSPFLIIRIQCESLDKRKMEKLILKLKGFKEVKEVGYQML